MDRSVLLLQIDYTAWASGLLLEACGTLAEEELHRDLQVSHGGLLATMRHIYYADRAWTNRLRGTRVPFPDPPPEPAIADLQQRWPALWGELKSVVAACSDEELASDFQYYNIKGEPLVTARWKALLHVVNHASLHRGQAMGMLRQLGHQPPATDLIFFYLQQAKA